MSISSELCEIVLAAALAEAKRIGVPMNIAILDEACHLKAFTRMDGALLGSIDIAIKKARTSSLFGMTTEDVGEFCKPGASSPGLEQTNGGLVVFAGGVPLRNGGKLVGSVGVSGGSVAQDQQVASAAASALRAQEKGAPVWRGQEPQFA